jgi:hypothetical protein
MNNGIYSNTYLKMNRTTELNQSQCIAQTLLPGSKKKEEEVFNDGVVCNLKTFSTTGTCCLTPISPFKDAFGVELMSTKLPCRCSIACLEVFQTDWATIIA